jgi:hypothetical protein
MKKLSTVLIIVLPLLVLVLVKVLSTGHFRKDTAKWAGSSLDRTNLVTSEHLHGLVQPVLLVNLADTAGIYTNFPGALMVNPENLLKKETTTKLQTHKGSIVLVSDDPALSARMWMLLSQMGYRNLFILADSTDNEVFKYKFRPDTVNRPEL